MRIDQILDQHKLMEDNPYIKSVLCFLDNGHDLLYTQSDVERYSDVIETDLAPLFEQYLQVGIPLDKSLLTVLVYHVLTSDYEESDTVAAIDFFMAVTQDDCEGIPQKHFKIIFSHMLTALTNEIKNVSNETRQRFLTFLVKTPYDIHAEIYDLITFFKYCLNNDPHTSVLNLDVRDVRDLAKFAYCCFKALLDRYYSSVHMQMASTIVVSAVCYKIQPGVQHHNTLVFMRAVANHLIGRSWFRNFYLKSLFETENPMLIVDLIKVLPKAEYTSLVNAIINLYTKWAERRTDRDMDFIQDIMHFILVNPYSGDYEDKQRQTHTDLIVKRTCFRLFAEYSKLSLDELERFMKLFTAWFDCKDLNLRRTLQGMFTGDDDMSARTLFETLKADVDINWQNKSYNIAFIQLSLNMFYFRPEFMINHYVRIVEMLAFRGEATDIEHCLPYLTKVIRRYSDRGYPAIKPFLGIITHFALIPTQIGKRFLFEVYNLISLAWDTQIEAGPEFAILEFFLSPDLRSREVFCALEAYFPMTEENIQVIFDERTLKYKDVAWAFLSQLLNRYEYTIFPAYFEQIVVSLDTPEFYVRPEAMYVVQCINKVYQMKVDKGKLTEQDKKLSAQALEIFFKHIVKCYIPLKLANEVIMLVHTLLGIVKNNIPGYSTWQEEIMPKILDEYNSGLHLVIARQCSYLAHLIGNGDIKVDNADAIRLMRILEAEEDVDATVLSKLILLLGKMCLKCTRVINQAVTVMRRYLSHHSNEVVISTLSNLYDIANIRLQNFANFDKDLLKLINCDCLEIQDLTLKLLLEMLGKDQVRLDREGSVALMLAIVDRNINVDIFLKDGRENEQLLKSEKLIKNSFIHLIFFLNEYSDNKGHHVTLPMVRTFTYECRCIIYRYLFRILQRHDQLNMLKVLCLEFIEPMYNGVIEINFRTLMVLKDCMTLVSYFAADNIATMEYDADKFYKAYMPKAQKLLVPDFNVQPIVTEFSNDLKIVVLALLRIVCKVERVSKDLLPQVYNTISLLTEAYYDSILPIVNENSAIRDKYNVYHTFFPRYKDAILLEPISARITADREEWKRYTQEQMNQYN